MRMIVAAFTTTLALTGTITLSFAAPEHELSSALAGGPAAQHLIGASNSVMASNNGVVPKDHPMHHFYKHKYRTPNSSGHGRRR
jgi:hypothetical protein